MTPKMTNKIASQMNGVGLGDFTVQDGINIANAASNIFAQTWDVTQNKKPTTTSNATPQVVYVTQPTGSSSSSYTPNYNYTQTQKQDDTLLYIALAGLGVLAFMFFNNKKK